MAPMVGYAKTAVLLAVLSALLILVGDALGGRDGMMLAFGFAVIMNFGSYWFSDRIVLTMYRAKQVGPEHLLYRTVQTLATRARLPMPKVYVIPSEAPNAFATGRSPAHASVAATEGLLRMLDQDELSGVMGHELAHVANRDILIQSVAATIGAAIMMLANMARWAAFLGAGSRDREGSNPFALIATALIAPLAAMLVQAAISRSREFAADEGGAKIAGSPFGLAQALRKLEAGVANIGMTANPATAHLFIVSPLSGTRGVLHWFSTHPPTEARVARLMQMRG
jgi:heat shock protein HtpX